MQDPMLSTFRGWVRLVESEFSEMPGLQLSKRQAQRMWNLDTPTADAIFDALEECHFLKRTSKNLYTRANVGR